MQDEPPTPIPIHKRKGQEARIQDLESNVGKLGGDIGWLRRQLLDIRSRLENAEFKLKVERNPDRDSSTSLSVRPTGMRVNFKNVSGWTVVATIIALALVVYLVSRR